MDVAVKVKTKKTYYWIIYYLVLGIIQAMWTNLSSFPPTIFRLAMIVAVFAPIFLNRSIILMAIPFSMILRGNFSTDYQYMPDIGSSEIYIGLEILAIIFHYNKLNFNNWKYLVPIIIFMVYTGLVDIIYTGEVGNYSRNIFIAVLLFPFIRSKQDFHLLSASFICACSILSVYYIVMFDKFAVTLMANIERSGWNDPNYFSTLVNYGFLVSIMYIMKYLEEHFIVFDKKILLAVCITIFAAVTLLASRAGFICFIVLLATVLIVTKIKWYWYFIGTGIISLVVYFMYNNGLFDVILYRLFEQENVESGGGRTMIWERALTNFDLQSLHNKLFGSGYLYRLQLAGKDPHNEFISILCDYGLIGIFLFCCIIFSLSRLQRGNFMLRNIPILFFIILLLSLSPFMYVYVCFLLMWIASLKILTKKQDI